MWSRLSTTTLALALMALLVAPLASADDMDMPDTSKVTCGSTIKLQHAGTKARLHSHDISYGSGSGQQSVTGFPQANDANSYWTVKAPHGGSCRVGEPLKNGDAFRLQHVNTRKWLHSHNHASPISHNQEVSCFGGEDESNVDDDWRVETQGGDATWSRNKKVRLVHVSTQVALHSHNQRFGRPISGQFEVCGSRSRDSNQLWIAAEGIYLPSPGPEDAKDEL